MQDFIRIGGEVISSPLNENFRRLLNAISIANVNLVFPEENGIVNTIADMYAIPNPQSAQTCYVISSGELYRYDKSGAGRWVKIADFGQTFRQGFLNSGAVVLEDYIKLKEGSTSVLEIPTMLVYFKNKEGDGRYLKGMYKIDAQDLDVSNVTAGNAYSIAIQHTGICSLISGMPSTDDPNNIYLGTFLVNSDGEVMKDFVFTLPDIAFTADRGYFLINGGEASGCNLVPGETQDNKVNRKDGYYYDEGINFTLGDTSDYPIDTDNGSNYDLKYYNAQSPVANIYYMVPSNPLQNEIYKTDGIICNKYWDGKNLVDVPNGYFTIQQHLVTPNGQNIILFGTKLYNSITDAATNLNSVYGLDISFPYIQATKIVVGSDDNFVSSNPNVCQFYTLGRLSQVGTISPEFADNVFKIYSGKVTDVTPAYVRFVLDALESEEYNSLYNLRVLPYNVDRKFFYDTHKYITDSIIDDVSNITHGHRITETLDGYYLADKQDLDDAIHRIDDIEAEIWATYDSSKQRYEQSIRKRLYDTEARLDADDVTLANHETRITSNEQNKVTKATTINGHTLGDTTGKSEAKAVTLVTGDIAEGTGSGGTVNQWFTQARVSENTDVVSAKAHADTLSATNDAEDHVKVNPHNLSTDDINYLIDTTKIFVTPEEERRIRADRLPENTIQALADLDAKNMDNIPITKLGGNKKSPTGSRTLLGNFKNLEFFEDGVDFDVSPNGETLTLNVRGQLGEDKVMMRNRYATLEAEYPSLYGGYVDKAVNAEFAYNVAGIEEANANQYYGTDSVGTVGIHDLPIYVSTVNQGSFASLDQIIFVPVDGSIEERHLTTNLANKINNNYHTIYDGGTLKSVEINTFKFGNNLTVDIDGHAATINATGSGGQSVTEFANLDDVDVVYTDNAGKMLIVNDTEDGIVLADTPSTKDFMRKSVYVSATDLTKVKKAEQADNATLAATATNASAVNSKVVDDTDTSTASLWTAAKIISNTTSQISNEGVNTYSGTSVPSDSLGKDGDLYILLED